MVSFLQEPLRSLVNEKEPNPFQEYLSEFCTPIGNKRIYILLIYYLFIKRFHYVVQAGLECRILLSQPSDCRAYRSMTLHIANILNYKHFHELFNKHIFFLVCLFGENNFLPCLSLTVFSL